MPTHRKLKIDYPKRGKTDRKIIYDRTETTTRQILGTSFLAGKWELLSQALHTAKERYSLPEGMPFLFMSRPVTVIIGLKFTGAPYSTDFQPEAVATRLESR